MKTLVIFPGSDTNTLTMFYLVDPETGECLDYHVCSGSWYAYGDLYTVNKEHLDNLYNDQTEAVFIDKTNYSVEELVEKNKKFRLEHGE